MQYAERQYPYVKMGAALAAAGAVAVAPVLPVAPWQQGLSAVERTVELVAGESILNIPFNLFQDFVNIPFNEMSAMNVLANSFFWTGNWWTPSATNIWGEDPGDPGHFMAIMDMMFPFAPEISGVYQPEIDPDALANGTAGIGQQFAMFAAAMLPVSLSCGAMQCAPMVPTEPITGITGLDRMLQFFDSIGPSDHQLPMFANWFKVPISDMLNGYHFADGPGDVGNPTAGGIVDPDVGVGEGGSVPGAPTHGGEPWSAAPQPGFGFPGTVEGPNGENLMPWAGIDFKLDPSAPFQKWFDSLMAPVDWSVNGDNLTTGFHFPEFTEFFQTLKALWAGFIIDFNPYVAGSPQCPGLCDNPPFSPPMGNTTLDLVKQIQAIGTPNPVIQQWIDLTEAADAKNAIGDANGATDEQVYAGIMGLQTGNFTFSPEQEAEIVAFLGPEWSKLLVNSGWMTDPGFLGPWESDGHGGFIIPGYDPNLPLDQQTLGDFGGLDTSLLWGDWLHVLDPTGGLYNDLADFWSQLSSAFTF
ncbi:hypothetical protein KIH27_16790 [Mycobacterium sp. M1]|uniref:PE-PPE domain-containing protein n=1 Tax=Mycolicibacter acidiphilus TaxID=2835306 RepID=A0ABS5RLQ7_9MYCO|nr:hypothetical protein [Mycolicibacter acidiphilus]MBS9535247.1 hypothetical protein [Mycolicibacter acidiphilus]